MLGSTRKLSMQKKDVPLDSKRFETEHDAATAEADARGAEQRAE